MPNGVPKARSLAILVFLVAFAGASAAAPESAPRYAPDAEVDVVGVVTAITQHAGWMGWDGVYVTLRTGKGEVHTIPLAPAEFLKGIEFTLAPGDAVEIRGAFAATATGAVLLVREIRRENVRIRLRNEAGHPIW